MTKKTKLCDTFILNRVALQDIDTKDLLSMGALTNKE